MTNTTQKQPSFTELLKKGDLAAIERLCINNPKLRDILLHWKGVRKTAFFRNRLRFYKNFARKSGVRKFTPEVKNQMREEFAQKHCLKQTLQHVVDSYDIAAFTTKISRIRFNQQLKRKQRRARML